VLDDMVNATQLPPQHCELFKSRVVELRGFDIRIWAWSKNGCPDRPPFTRAMAVHAFVTFRTHSIFATQRHQDCHRHTTASESGCQNLRVSHRCLENGC
jgi:hypothetical protein